MGKKLYHIHIILLAVLFSLLQNSCEDHNNEPGGPGSPGSMVAFGFAPLVEGVSGSATRAVTPVTSFPKDGTESVFGMFVHKTTGSQGELFQGSGDMKVAMHWDNRVLPHWQNKFYGPNGQGLTAEGMTGKTVRVIAYYPYAGAAATRESVPFDFSMPNPSQTDLLFNTRTEYTTGTGQVSGGFETIPLEFSHAYCWLVIHVRQYMDRQNGTGGTNKLSSVSVTNFSGSWIKNKGGVDPATGLVTDGSTAGPITFKTDATLSTSQDATLEFLVPAFMDAGVKSGDIVFELTINGTPTIFPLSVDQLNADGGKRGFQSGKKNTYNLLFNNSDLSVSLRSWNTVTLAEDFGTAPAYNKQGIKYTDLLLNVQSPGLGWYPRIQSLNPFPIHTDPYLDWLTTVDRGGNGGYVTKDNNTVQPLEWETDDRNVATQEPVCSEFDMTMAEVGGKMVSWQNQYGVLEAKELCRQYRGGGFSDWRLPRASEFRMAVCWLAPKGGRDGLLLNDKEGTPFWTATEGSETEAWTISTKWGGGSLGSWDAPTTRFRLNLSAKSGKAYVRCIRVWK